MRLYNLPNNTQLTDRERTFFGTSMYTCGIFDYKMSDDSDPIDTGDSDSSGLAQIIIPKLSAMYHLRKVLHILTGN